MRSARDILGRKLTGPLHWEIDIASPPAPVPAMPGRSRYRNGTGSGSRLGWFLDRPSSRSGHFDALDGLRGLAVLIVIASHLSLLGFRPGVAMGGAGKSGVYLFFVLSAFLLTRLLLYRTPDEFLDARLWAAYALRRILRIWPLYLVVLLLSWGLTETGVVQWHFQLDTPAFLRHLSLREGQSVLWSVPVEFKFYLWLPFIALGLAWMAQRGWRLPVQAAIAVSAIALCMVLWPPDATGRNDVRLGPYLALFLCGAFAAALDHRLGTPGGHRRAWGVLALCAAAAFLGTIPSGWAWLTGHALDRNLNHEWFLFFGVLWSALLLSILRGPRVLGAVFALAPLRLVGVVSFSAYLWHMPVIDAFAAMGARRWPAAPALVIAGILLAAMVSFLVVERPWRDVRFRARTAPRVRSIAESK